MQTFYIDFLTRIVLPVRFYESNIFLLFNVLQQCVCLCFAMQYSAMLKCSRLRAEKVISMYGGAAWGLTTNIVEENAGRQMSSIHFPATAFFSQFAHFLPLSLHFLFFGSVSEKRIVLSAREL